MIKRIFLDLDDVLNTFTLSALQFVGCQIGPFDYDKYRPEWKFDIVKAANALLSGKEFNSTSFWTALSPEFWKSISKSQEFSWLLSLCKILVGRENVCILTAPIIPSYVASAKVDWITTYCPRWLHHQFLIGPDKTFCASSAQDALLIDDSDANVNAFRDHGGQAILVPRPWNTLYGKDTTTHVITEVCARFHQRRNIA